jgi:hypothetical protein
MDAIIAAAEAAVSGLVGERGPRLAQELEDDALPHLLVHNPVVSRTRLDWAQLETTTQIPATLVTRYESQEATLLKADAIRAAIDADRTLGGVVDDAFVVAEPLREDPRERDRIVEMLIETSEVI